ncbi:MAG: rRNA maturation RNase YbeY [Phycisphaerae bacterium]
MAVAISIHPASALVAGKNKRDGKIGPPQLTGADITWLRARLRQVCLNMGIRNGVWAVQIVTDSEMEFLHQKYFGIAKTTDVITFDMRDDGGRLPTDPLELDTAICADEAHRQSCSRKIELRSELLLYAVHSLLHVRGYDDKNPADARRMHRREDELLTDLGIGPVYRKSRNATCRR